MEETTIKKLYLVTCKGMQLSMSGGVAYGIAYVVATDPTSAYEKLLKSLRKRDLGFSSDRVLDTVQLLAEDAEFAECGSQLIL